MGIEPNTPTLQKSVTPKVHASPEKINSRARYRAGQSSLMRAGWAPAPLRQKIAKARVELAIPKERLSKSRASTSFATWPISNNG